MNAYLAQHVTDVLSILEVQHVNRQLLNHVASQAEKQLLFDTHRRSLPNDCLPLLARYCVYKYFVADYKQKNFNAADEGNGNDSGQPGKVKSVTVLDTRVEYDVASAGETVAQRVGGSVLWYDNEADKIYRKLVASLRKLKGFR